MPLLPLTPLDGLTSESSRSDPSDPPMLPDEAEVMGVDVASGLLTALGTGATTKKRDC